MQMSQASVLFAPSVSSKRQSIFLKNLSKVTGGPLVIAHAKPAKKVRKREEHLPDLDPRVTHVIVEANSSTYVRVALAQQLGVALIPDGIKIVDAKWVEEMLKTKALADESPFILAEVKETREEDNSEKVSSSIYHDLDHRPAKKARHSGKDHDSNPVPATHDDKKGGGEDPPGGKENHDSKPLASIFLLAKKQQLKIGRSSGSKKGHKEDREEKMDAKTSSDSQGAEGAWWETFNLTEMLPASLHQLDSSNKCPIKNSTYWYNIGEEGSVLYREHPDAPKASTKISAFDMDGCLITTRSGKRFAQNAQDWRFLYPDIPAKLAALAQDGHRLVIISNQNGLAKKKVNKSELIEKVDTIVARLGVPIDVLLSGQEDIFRKPCPGTWCLLLAHLNGGLVPRAEDCVYVGDAAGRPKEGARKQDHSAGDLKFALNLGLRFATPEEFFAGASGGAHVRCERHLRGLDPRHLPRSPQKEEREQDGGGIAGQQEVVVLCGPMACGKSTLARRKFMGYERVNQDTLKTFAKCAKVAEAALAAGRSVVVDNTNRDRKTRAQWVALAENAGVPVRCVQLEASKDLCFHLNGYRGVAPWGEQRRVPSMVIHTYFKYFEPPSEEEGFTAVERVAFAAGPFESPAEELLLRMFVVP